jgi:hypothetical protein
MTVSYEDVCQENTYAFPGAAFAGGTAPTKVALFNRLGPDYEDTAVGIRALLADGSGSLCGDRAKPRKLGPDTPGWIHAMMGDFAMLQWTERFSSEEGPRVVGGGGGTSGAAIPESH